jgi:hypothetical protein
MHKKVFWLFTFICISFFMLISCDFLENELNLRSSGGGGGKGTVSTITVMADAAWKYSGEADPAFTYTYSPDPLPSGVSLTGELTRDPGEDWGSYVIRQGTLKLTGENASKYSLDFIAGVFYVYTH